MTMQAPVDPIRIYVLWHSDSPDGGHLAQAIFHWFRGSPDDLNEAGYGVPVHYRFKPGADDERRPRPIDPKAAEINIVVPLVDENMVTDPDWRRYLQEVAKKGSYLYPVVLHPAAYNLPAPLASLNFIRLDRPTDPVSWPSAERLAARRERLLSLLTQASCRLLQAYPERVPKSNTAGKHKGEAGLPVSVFLSHAKADGVAIAAALRDGLLHHGQLQVFFDESDLPFGYGYSERLIDAAGAAKHHTAAMIAVYTDAYAGRPWCQRELRLARSPVRLDGADGCRWGNKPLLVLDHLENRRTRFLGEIGQAPVIRWDPARLGMIIDLLLREILFTLYYRRWARRLALPPGTHAFSGTLDLHVAMRIHHETGGSVKRILVPPPGPAMTDRRWLTELLPDIKVSTFEELEKGLL